MLNYYGQYFYLLLTGSINTDTCGEYITYIKSSFEFLKFLYGSFILSLDYLVISILLGVFYWIVLVDVAIVIIFEVNLSSAEHMPIKQVTELESWYPVIFQCPLLKL